MRAISAYATPGEWRVTSEGADAARDAETCTCEYLMVIEGVQMCTECDTVFGVVFAYANPTFLSARRRRPRERAKLRTR